MRENLSFEPNNKNEKNKVGEDAVKGGLEKNGCKGCGVLEQAFAALKRFKQNI